jgi:phosphoglycolate phosphatase
MKRSPTKHATLAVDGHKTEAPQVPSLGPFQDPMSDTFPVGEMTPKCNICGSATFVAIRSRPNVQCAECGSVERTRVLKLVLDKHQIPRKGQRMLHVAPENHLAQNFRSILGAGYDPVDISPGRYQWESVRPFDLATDAETLKSRSYDVILHSHVMEHIRCNVTAVLYHLHRALKRGGYHVFCIPILPGTYAADLGNVTAETARREFGQHDHVRRFGADDLAFTLGMIFNLPPNYDLTGQFEPAQLDACNIPVYARTGWSPHSVVVMRKNDIRLTA